MAIVSSNQFDLVPNSSLIGRGIREGQQISQFKNQKQDMIKKQRQQDSINQFSSKAISGDRGALNQVASIDPERASKILNFMSSMSDEEREQQLRENEELTKHSLIANNLEPGKRRAYMESVRESIQSKGGDTSSINKVLSGDDESLFQNIESQSILGQEISDIAKQLSPKQSPLTKEERILQAAGVERGSEEFNRRLLGSLDKKPSVNVNVQSKANQKFQEKLSEINAKRYGFISDQADTAIESNQSLDVIESIDLDTDALEPAKQAIASFANSIGFDSSRIANIEKGEAFNAEAQRIVLSAKSLQKGPQTDADERTIRKTVASLGNTKQGNQFIIDSARALNNRKIERKEFYDAFIQENDGNFKDSDGKTADAAWAEFSRNTPMISSKQRTKEGLPVFFFKFEESVRRANPDATRAEIIQAWKDREAK